MLLNIYIKPVPAAATVAALHRAAPHALLLKWLAYACAQL